MPCACHNEAVEENWEGGAYWIAQEMCNMAFQMQLTCQMVSSTLVWSLGGESKLISLAQKQGFNEIFFFWHACLRLTSLGSVVPLGHKCWYYLRWKQNTLVCALPCPISPSWSLHFLVDDRDVRGTTYIPEIEEISCCFVLCGVHLVQMHFPFLFSVSARERGRISTLFIFTPASFGANVFARISRLASANSDECEAVRFLSIVPSTFQCQKKKCFGQWFRTRHSTRVWSLDTQKRWCFEECFEAWATCRSHW